jgi:hypothetical protein
MAAIFFDLDGTLTAPKIGICGIWRRRSAPSGPGPFSDGGIKSESAVNLS